MASITHSSLSRKALQSISLQARHIRPTLNSCTPRPPTLFQTRISPSVFNTSLTPTTTRKYHSALHPRLPDYDYTNSQAAILTAALSHVPTHGFTAISLTLGAHDAGFLDVSVQLLPRGELDLILFWLASRRGLLRGKVEEGALFNRIAAERGIEPQALGVDEKIKALIMERLKMNDAIREQWQGALAHMSLLGNIPLSIAELHALSNDILLLADDPAVNSAWYTRRVAVSAVYASAEVFMTRDTTADLSETASYVERRFEDKEALALKFNAVSQCIGFLSSSAIGVGRSWGLKV
ncbi:hypothetical protein N7495_003614 [Penicillium taxi]|uniref:uncharacterized protein n=1 Tax=Penicillium taxi TaxID=168475 RepID=UPI002544E963|nr:uncharacterized protein N7495_003614 [Penicillium taxi]KAJ5898870.1 hypothetical protein N7495_003614 [Penicillium taxi]